MSEATGWCTGACCTAFTLYAGTALPMSLDDVLDQTQRILDSDRGMTPQNALVFYARPVVSKDEHPRFRCEHLTDARLCRIYATRPDTCRDFPSNQGEPCRSCGFSVAKRRRRTRRMIREAARVSRLRLPC